MHIRSRGRHSSFVLVALALVVTACSGSTTTTISDTAQTAGSDTSDAPTEQVSPQPEPTAIPDPTAPPAATPTPTPIPDPTPTPVPDQVFFASEMQPGDCFNRLEGNPPFTPPDIVSCDELHDEEVYAMRMLDDPLGTPYPGEDAMADRVAAELCDAADVEFFGATWDLLPVGTALLFPLEEEWDAGDRTIMCSARSSEQDTRKIGTAAGGSIQTDDVVVARASLASDGVDFDDWVVLTQHDNIDTAGSISDGQFDIPLRRPFSIPFGFMFHAKEPGDEGHATTAWGYNWENGEYTDLGSILPGRELASTVVADGTAIFASRAAPGDDWDLWSTASGDAQVLIGGEGDQQYPTLTPDQTRLVYQDNGDIWVADIDGSNALQLTSGPASEWESIVSPDGSTVVFASDRSGNDDLWAVPITGGEAVNLTNHPADESWPVFSEDGERIYFASDRLLPEDDRQVVMVMNADGSDQSWFASMGSAQPIVVPQAVAGVVLDNALTLNERYNYEPIEGEDGTTTTWTHSTGRLTVDLPAGWRVSELDQQTGFIAAPQPEDYFDVWEADGVLVSLWEGESDSEFFERYDEVLAVESCEQFDGTDAVVPLEGDLLFRSGNFDCGAAGAVGGVLMFYDTTTQVGVIIEGQRDNLPDAESDSEMLTAIARSLIWS